MARLDRKGSFRLHGKLDRSVFCTWRDIDYMRRLPDKTKSEPSQAQIANRAKFAFVHDWLESINDLVKVTFDTYSPKMTGRMAAQSYTMRNAVKGKYPDFEIDYPSALISCGRLAGVTNPKVSSPEPGFLQINWDKIVTDRGKSHCNDILVFALAPDAENVTFTVGQATRDKGNYLYKIPREFIGKTAYVYIAFKSFSNNDVSTSQYLGSIILE